MAEIERARATPGCTGMIFDIDYQGARQIRSEGRRRGQRLHPAAVDAGARAAPARPRERDRGGHCAAATPLREREIEHYALFDYVIVNDDVERAFDELRSIIVAERARRAAARAPLAEALLRTGRLSEDERMSERRRSLGGHRRQRSLRDRRALAASRSSTSTRRTAPRATSSFAGGSARRRSSFCRATGGATASRRTRSTSARTSAR